MKTIKALQKLLAGTQIFLANVHGYHWNITGITFFFLHAEFGNLYDKLSANADKIAERIRALNGTPEHRYSEYIKLSGIKEAAKISYADGIILEIVLQLNSTILALNEAMSEATVENDQGTMNMIADMLEDCQKTLWMYKANIPSTLLNKLKRT